MPYKPRPLDTADIELSEDLLALTEELAQNNHDVWAQQRIADGWSYGPQRDDMLKKHPDLVSYANLPPAEKEYDRRAALETIKAIVKLGYQFKSPAQTSPRTALPMKASPRMDDLSSRIIAETLERLCDRRPISLADLRATWDTLSQLEKIESPEIYRFLSDRLLNVSEPLMAYDVLTRGLTVYPRDVRMRQLLGLALARSGSLEEAHGVLYGIFREGHIDGETLGILARTHKDLSVRATNKRQQNSELRRAHDYYYRAYRLAIRRDVPSDAIYTGINAATTALLLGRARRADALARRVRTLCIAVVRAGDDYWAEATLGEAAVILGDRANADMHYQRAAELGRGRFADLASTRRNVQLLLEYRGEDRHRYDSHFGIPKIIVFAGHMVDQPGRAKPRFPQGLCAVARRAIGDRIARYSAKIGYSGAACGSDILFLEEMQRQNSETHVVLPISHKEFVNNSVRIAPGDWVRRFNKVLNDSATVVVASERRASLSGAAYEYSNLIQVGLATLRARMLDTEVVPLIFWDGQLGDGRGGTAAMVSYWRSSGLEPEIIDPSTLQRGRSMTGIARSSQICRTPHRVRRPRSEVEFPQQLMAMLFADVAGYSKIQEEQVPDFVRYFMGAVARLLTKSAHRPVVRATWGDALYFVFPSVRAAGILALELVGMIKRTDWTRVGLPADLSLRVGLHAGPVYSCKDPVIGRKNYTGTHVSRAARIEPIVPPGLVYASRPFAALAAAEGITDFVCNYVGQTGLAKGYGEYPTYHVSWPEVRFRRRRRPR